MLMRIGVLPSQSLTTSKPKPLDSIAQSRQSRRNRQSSNGAERTWSL